MESAHELIIANISDTVHLAYLDSGPVPNSNDFVTIVLAHGFIFNAYNMERLLPFAHKYNIRLILMMRRDYPGSSPFTEEEITLATENPELFFKKSGALYLQFLHHILKNTHVCKATEDRSRGGICLGAWSLGNGFGMWTLCGEDELVDRRVYDDLEPYLSTYIFIDPPNAALGARRQGEEEIYDPLRAGDGMTALRQWLSSYFDHPSPWDGTLTKLDQRGGLGRKASIFTWNDEEIERWVSDSALKSDSLVLLNDVSQSWLTKMSTEVFFGKPKMFPRLRLEYIFGGATCWCCVLPWDTFSNKRVELKNKGEDVGLRRVKFTLIPGGNHFMHTDAPEGFMRMIKTRLEEESDDCTTLCTASIWD